MDIDLLNIDVSEFNNNDTSTILNSNIRSDIAIIGIAIKSPGADNTDEFWRNLKIGVNSIGDLSIERKEFNIKYLESVGISREKIKFNKAGYLREIDEFDYEFFNITPKEAELMDPNQRIFLQTAWEAIEDSGYGGDKLIGSKTGIYVGFGDDADYYNIISNVENDSLGLAKSGNLRPIIASRLAYILDLKGPNMIIDTTCSSSLVSIHTACQAIRNNECNLAIAGGIKISVLPTKNNSNIGVESSSDKIKTFDDNADGALWGEGVGVLILKPLKDAIADKDSIYAIIKGSCINQDGTSVGITAPNQKAQTELVTQAWEKAGINPETIRYIESHGTGTKLGDPIEIAGLTNAFKKYTNRKQFCGIGSVKTNIGHLVHASGVVGIIKVLLMMKYNEIPPIVNFNTPNRNIDFVNSPIFVNDRLQKLSDEGEDVICGVSSFGVSGTNAHIVLEKYPVNYLDNNENNEGYKLLVLSAKSKESLENIVGKYIEYLNDSFSDNLNDVCYTSNTGRGHYNFRLAIVFKNLDDLKNKLKNIKSKNVFYGEHKIININNNDFECNGVTLDEIKKLNQTAELKLCEYLEEKRYTNLCEIAKLYVAGANIKWDKLYINEEVRRIHLPVYQFKKTKCFVKFSSSKIIVNDIRQTRKDFIIDNSIILRGKNDGNYTENQKIIATLIKNIMGYNEINIGENFSSLGGDSITLTKLHSDLVNIFEIDMKISDIFSHPTVEKLSKCIDNYKKSVDKEISKNDKISSKTATNKDIAVIGVGVKFPKAESIDEYWENILNKKECIEELSSIRKKQCDDYLKFTNNYNENIKYAKGGYISGIDEFDYKFFGISPKEAELMDPHQRLFLQISWKAIEDAGYTKESIRGSRTGVYIGYTNDFRFNYWKIINDIDDSVYKLSVTPNLSSIIPSRISYLLDLKGPSLLVDTACSSSLVSIHLACKSIQNNECDMAIAGGVRVDIMPIYDKEKNIGIESPNFKVKAFDENSNGTVWGEGVVALILKPLDKAIKDKDNIYTVIKGSAINQDGASMGITSPNPDAQTDVITRAWNDAQINPETISYVESHGTGTLLGDPIEIEGLSNAFKQYTNKKQFCGVGSIKPNIGHLDSVAGAASFVKAMLALKNKKIPPCINFQTPNKKIDFEKSPVYVCDKSSEWESNNMPRRCGVSSFGFSGTNCHIILEEPPAIEKHTRKNKLMLLTISGKSIYSLWCMLDEYKKFLKKNSNISLSDLCYTSSVCRNHYDYRLAIIFSDVRELESKIDKELSNGCLEFYQKILNREYRNSNIDIDSTIKKFIKKNRYNLDLVKIIGDFYENGGEINWNLLYENDLYFKLSIPVHKFKLSKSWINIPRGSNEKNLLKNIMLNKNISKELHDELKLILENSNKNCVENYELNEIIISGRENNQYSELERKIAMIWCEVLGLKEINVNDNFYELGGHSISMMQIVAKINSQLNIDVSYNNFNSKNTISGLAELLKENDNTAEKNKYPTLSPDPLSMYNMFPLTDVQMSYFLGRKESFQMGGVCTHVYMEIESSLDIKKLNDSLNKVIDRHPMLRAIVNKNGFQEILKEKCEFDINIIDISNLNDKDKHLHITREREKMSHHVFIPDKWPLMNVIALKLEENKHYLFIGFDMLIADGTSLQIIGNDWMTYYENMNAKLPKIEFTLRDYILGLQEFKKTKVYSIDREYWENKLESFPPAPNLLYKQEPANVIRPHFKRLSKVFKKENWEKVKRVSQKLNVSPSALLCTAYSEILAYWSNQTEFSINLTVFNRYPFHKDVDNIVGDFTSVMLIPIKMDNDISFFDKAKIIQKKLLESLDHRHYDGIELIRKIAARDNKIGSPVMPIVFTSMLFNDAGDPWSEIGNVKMGLSQTPQVYLDNQAGEIGGNLVINWDYVEEIFEENVIQNMFNQYTGILEYLINLDEEENIYD